MNNMEKKTRIEWVDNAKAFACLLVVLGHLLQSLIKITPSFIAGEVYFVNWFIYLFHMPLFMCLSGFLFFSNSSIHCFSDYTHFISKKIVNILVPYITFYSLTIILNIAFSKSVNTPMGLNEWYGLLNNPISPYWFLYSLLSIFMVVPLLNMLTQNKYISFLVFIILKFLSFFINTRIFFIDSIMSYGIYFYLGFFMKDMLDFFNKKNNLILILLYVICSFILYLFNSTISHYSFVNSIVYAVMGFGGTIITVSCFMLLKQRSLFTSFKTYTFQIFLMHTIFAAGIRILLYRFGIYNWYIHFIIGMVVSIYIPVLVSITSDKFKYTNFFFYPIKTIKKFKKG